MSPLINKRVLFNEVPTGYPDPEKTVILDKSQTIDPDTVPLNGGVLLKVLSLSIDPYMRGKMRKPEKGSYNTAFTVGEPLAGLGVGVVLRSEEASVSPGDHLYGLLPHVEYAVITSLKSLRKLKNVENLPWSAYLGVCGMPGQTAYHGWKAYVQPHIKKGDTLFVTTGAGPVGSFVIQLAKFDGLKVIASAGSSEKVKFMQDCGADVAFNYKTTSTKEVLDQHGPINVYWDHVGGEILDIALNAAAPFAHFIEVGMISGYNGEGSALKNIGNVLFKSITMQGFIVSNLAARFDEEFYQEVPLKVASGQLKYTEDARKGLESVGQTLLDVQTGKNKGKAVVIVADE